MALPNLDVLLKRGNESKAGYQWLEAGGQHLLGPRAPEPRTSTADSPLGRALRPRGAAMDIVSSLEAEAREAQEARAARERRAHQILRPPAKVKVKTKAKVAPSPLSSPAAPGADDGDGEGKGEGEGEGEGGADEGSPRPALLPLQYVLPPQDVPQFPSLDAVSPRTRRKLTRLPKPSQIELDKVSSHQPNNRTTTKREPTLADSSTPTYPDRKYYVSFPMSTPNVTSNLNSRS